jgi:hypothetical protein
MLTAIQEFVRDSFGSAGGRSDELDVTEISAHTVWLFPEPEATLGVVFRGTPRLTLRQHFSTLSETLQHDHAQAFSAFNGDTAAFQMLDPLLGD